ncbi:MAG: hypothetical protein IJC33_01125 [Clostridia bacterium]|nr:hypothetical protein [Clostridia bacterium]
MKKNGRAARGSWEQSRLGARRSPGLTAIYVVLRVIVITMLVLNILQKEYESAFICGLALVLFMIPSALERRLRIDIPSVMEVVILLFIFAAEILGELESYYLQYPYWDTMLHTVNGFLCAAVGFSLIDILTRNKQEKFRLSPLYVALVAFCFSMTIGVLWEFFEYGMDVLFHTDMQKDTVIGSVFSASLGAGPVTALEEISSVTVNGRELGVEGYLDIGLHDTMADLFVNFIGAVVFSALGYVYIRGRGTGRSGRVLRHFLPALEEDSNTEE